MSGLTGKRCVPCEGGVPRLDGHEAARLLHAVDGCSLGNERISKEFAFKSFVDAIAFVNRVFDLAETIRTSTSITTA